LKDYQKIRGSSLPESAHFDLDQAQQNVPMVAGNFSGLKTWESCAVPKLKV
jgi:hypothetical protein